MITIKTKENKNMSSVSSQGSRQGNQAQRQRNQDKKKKSFLGGIKKFFTNEKNPPNAAQQGLDYFERITSLADAFSNGKISEEDYYKQISTIEIQQDNPKITDILKNQESWDNMHMARNTIQKGYIEIGIKELHKKENKILFPCKTDDEKKALALNIIYPDTLFVIDNYKHLNQFLLSDKIFKRQIIDIMFESTNNISLDKNVVQKDKQDVLSRLLLELRRGQTNQYFPSLNNTENTNSSDKKATEEILEILNEKINSGEVTPTKKDKERIAKLKEWIGEC